MPVSNLSRRSVLSGVAAGALLGTPTLASAQAGPARAQALAAMKRATRFMTDKVAVNGGYVWSYLSDFSRRWGEMEAYPSMIWTQAPGTPEMGQLFLDAYHATGDEDYCRAAEAAAGALIWGQHPSGGWNYVIDFAGEPSIKRWYDTIGRNGWRLEEFQHYYGNATFDDHATIESARLLLRLYLEKRDARYLPPVEKAVRFVLDSQYPVGGWPQRWPRTHEFQNHGNPDYTGFITFNDEVHEQNLDFLLLVYRALGDARVLEPIQRAMNVVVLTQQGAPSPGWSLQHSLDLKPAGARTYEPLSLATHTTAANLNLLMDFYELTGDSKYLARVPEGIAWLETLVAPASTHTPDGRTHWTHIEQGTNRPIFVRRRGSNAQNGEYYVNYDPAGIPAQRRIDTARLRARHQRLLATPPEEASRNSPLKTSGGPAFPKYIVTSDIVGSDLNAPSGARAADAANARKLVDTLNAQGYWPTELRTTSHPYRGPGPAQPPAGFVDRGQVGDAWDTSPFTEPNGPMGISTAAYLRNMSQLIGYLERLR
jgi:hypothetical protein